jgi:hypothetical protein
MKQKTFTVNGVKIRSTTKKQAQFVALYLGDADEIISFNDQGQLTRIPLKVGTTVIIKSGSDAYHHKIDGSEGAIKLMSKSLEQSNTSAVLAKKVLAKTEFKKNYTPEKCVQIICKVRDTVPQGLCVDFDKIVNTLGSQETQAAMLDDFPAVYSHNWGNLLTWFIGAVLNDEAMSSKKKRQAFRSAAKTMGKKAKEKVRNPLARHGHSGTDWSKYGQS